MNPDLTKPAERRHREAWMKRELITGRRWRGDWNWREKREKRKAPDMKERIAVRDFIHRRGWEAG